MKFQVILSCMHNKDFSIIERSGLGNVNTLVINQCDTNADYKVEEGIHTMIYTATRGLSVSRNMAIDNSDADICLVSDDDEFFVPDLEKLVVDAYEKFPQADLIVFRMVNRSTKLGDKPKKLSKLELLRVSSWQISFKLASVKGKVAFDTNLGAGTKNGAGEENKFLLDCYRAGLSIYYVPIKIAAVAQESSTWFHGYDRRFFFNRGKTTRYILGLPLSLLYAVHYLVTKRRRYTKDISVKIAAKELFRGIFAKGINASFE